MDFYSAFPNAQRCLKSNVMKSNNRQFNYRAEHVHQNVALEEHILLLFFTSVIFSILQYCNTTWYKCLSTALKSKLLQSAQRFLVHPVRDVLTQQTIIT